MTTTTANGSSSAASDSSPRSPVSSLGARAVASREAHAHLVMTEGFNQQASALERREGLVSRASTRRTCGEPGEERADSARRREADRVRQLSGDVARPGW
jgi:hypothetical protein